MLIRPLISSAAIATQPSCRAYTSQVVSEIIMTFSVEFPMAISNSGDVLKCLNITRRVMRFSG